MTVPSTYASARVIAPHVAKQADDPVRTSFLRTPSARPGIECRHGLRFGVSNPLPSPDFSTSSSCSRRAVRGDEKNHESLAVLLAAPLHTVYIFRGYIGRVKR